MLVYGECEGFRHADVCMFSVLCFILWQFLNVFVQTNTLCRFGCMYFLAALVSCVCRCDGDVICVGHDMNRCSEWWYVCNVNVK